MPAKSTIYKFYLYNKILQADTITESPYFNCDAENCKYYIILDLNLKCAECVCQSCPYINILQTSLNKTREEYKKKIKKDKKELALVITRLLKDKKILA